MTCPNVLITQDDLPTKPCSTSCRSGLPGYFQHAQECHNSLQEGRVHLYSLHCLPSSSLFKASLMYWSIFVRVTWSSRRSMLVRIFVNYSSWGVVVVVVTIQLRDSPFFMLVVTPALVNSQDSTGRVLCQTLKIMIATGSQLYLRRKSLLRKSLVRKSVMRKSLTRIQTSLTSEAGEGVGVGSSAGATRKGRNGE